VRRGDLRTKGTAEFFAAGSALAVGALGWLIAHLVTFWLLTHSHHGTLSLAGRHLHAVAAAEAVAAAGVAAAALAAVPLGAALRRRRPRRTSVHLAVGLSTAAFVTADAVEHALLGLAPSPPATLFVGACLHALFGVGGSLLWVRLALGVRIPAVALRPAPAVARPGLGGRGPRRCRRLLCSYAVAGRAPPAC
jgi:hypothetical protein